jgi:hypothetical protein
MGSFAHGVCSPAQEKVCVGRIARRELDPGHRWAAAQRRTRTHRRHHRARRCLGGEPDLATGGPITPMRPCVFHASLPIQE